MIWNDETQHSVVESVSGTLSEQAARKALSDLGVFERSYDGGAGFASSLWKSWGYTDADQQAGLWLMLIHPHDVHRVSGAYSRVLSGEQAQFHEEFRVRTPGGRWRWIISRGRIIERNETGEPLRYLGSEMDISDRKRSEEELNRARAGAEQTAQEAETLRKAGAIVASSLRIEETVALVLDQTSKVVPYDTASVQLLRENTLEIVGGNGWANMGQIVGKTQPVPDDNPYSEVLAKRAPLRLGDVRDRYPEFHDFSGETIRSWIGIPLIVHGETLGLLTLHKRQRDFFTADHVRLAASFADHVAVALYNARLYEETHRLAMTDHLTGLATRRAFMVHADTLAEQAARYHRPLAVLMMDIDLFKRINDVHGHVVGDQVLELVACTARDILRKADVLCRYGGEEFVALLPETELPEACRIAERLRLAVARLSVDGLDRPITISIGVSSVRFETEHKIDRALQRADEALYRSKADGRNRSSVE